MAITPTKNPAYPNHDLITWQGLSTGETTGVGQLLLGNGDRTVQLTGTIGSTATVVTIQGSLNNVDWEALQDLEGNALTFSGVKGIKGILESPPWIRPIQAGSTGGTDLTVLISVNRSG